MPKKLEGKTKMLACGVQGTVLSSVFLFSFFVLRFFCIEKAPFYKNTSLFSNRKDPFNLINH